ncbi:MAG: 3-oxoacyl-[acyl-carrier-protein] reductase [Pirellulaceae bacterium]
MGKLDGKVAVVTGASRGIGRAIAVALANEGAKVAINYQSSDAKAQEVVDEIAKAGGTAILAKADISSPDAAKAMIQSVVEQLGSIDILVNNAGITRDKSIRKMVADDWDTVIQTNLNPVFYCTSAVIPKMTEQKWGRIVNISSMNGQIPSFGQANYSASKGGIIAFTKTAALELARFNITVNTVAPGFTETDMAAKIPADVREQIHGRIPLGRFGTPDEIAEAVVFLAGGANYITGQQINVNGGAFM